MTTFYIAFYGSYLSTVCIFQTTRDFNTFSKKCTRASYLSHSNVALQRTNTENSKRIFSENEFPHSCVCERFIYSHDRSASSAAGNMSWEYINRSQTHECENWDWGRAIPRKGIHKWDFHCSVLVCGGTLPCRVTCSCDGSGGVFSWRSCPCSALPPSVPSLQRWTVGSRSPQPYTSKSI